MKVRGYRLVLRAFSQHGGPPLMFFVQLVKLAADLLNAVSVANGALDLQNTLGHTAVTVETAHVCGCCH